MKRIVMVIIFGLFLLVVSFNRSIPECTPSEIQSGKYHILKMETVTNIDTKLVLRAESGEVLSTKLRLTQISVKNLNGYIYIDEDKSWSIQ
jgi:hypothetical protein